MSDRSEIAQCDSMAAIAGSDMHAWHGDAGLFSSSCDDRENAKAAHRLEVLMLTLQ